MKYKFIGTEKDLLDNGFIKRFDEYRRVGSKAFYIAIEIDKKISINWLFCNPNYNFYDGVGATKPYIQDLIDKGLVVENE